jgi:cardiolipin synthase
VAYVGGFNVGREYLGLHKKIGYWRDTHLRIVGGAVVSLQMRFIMDWNYAAGENLLQNPRMFVDAAVGKGENCKMQIISSGPDHTAQPVRDNYLRLIAGARHSIYIQTPYFIPDETIFNALLLAARSGISVNIMIPCKPDHLFVYWATYSYVGDMVAAGANCYTYNNGFLHSKGLVTDGEVLCYGTANMDIRSFYLNYEVNAVIYSKNTTGMLEKIFENDSRHCVCLTKEQYRKRNIIIKMKQKACKKLSPML